MNEIDNRISSIDQVDLKTILQSMQQNISDLTSRVASLERENKGLRTELNSVNECLAQTHREQKRRRFDEKETAVNIASRQNNTDACNNICEPAYRKMCQKTFMI